VSKTRARRPIPSTKPTPIAKPNAAPRIWICLTLLLATCAVYAPTSRFDFVNFDDPEMVTANAHVRQGMTPAGILWALTSVEAANWFPVTRLSHMLDFQLFGMRSGWHHLVNVLLHALAAIVLFLFLDRATRTRWPSALVAFVFALHPLHVESVAWVSERKDVLSALFWFLALLAYVRYTESPSVRRYLAVTGWFVLGLMAKPMIVTLPLVLLLLDFWPLQRRLGAALLREKIPLFALSAAASVVTYLVQRQSGAVGGLATLPLDLRLGNALLSCFTYLSKMFWPSGLAVFYPYPAEIPLWQTALAAALMAALTWAALRLWRQAPYLAIGWFWYLVTLAPVIGLVQVGGQARADRYTYVPMIGIAISLAWGGADLLRRWPRARIALAVVLVLACVPVTWAQVAYWRNSETLFRRTLAVTSGNDVAEHNLGNYLMDAPGGLPEAITHLQASLRIQPQSAKAHTDLAAALARMPGQLPEALAEYRQSLRLEPDSPITHTSLGNTLASMGRLPEARAEYQTALRLAPDSAIPHNNLGNTLAKMGQVPEAIGEYETALRLDPNSPEAHNNLGMVLANLPGRLPEALAHFEAVLRIKPDSADAHINMGKALAIDPARLSAAISEYQVALRLNPDSAEAHNDLGMALARMGRQAEALAEYQAALRADPNSAVAHYNLGAALAKLPGREPEALEHLEAALRLMPNAELKRIVERLRAAAVQ
jgi:tetratricopeptide (TPR) repeat protein